MTKFIPSNQRLALIAQWLERVIAAHQVTGSTPVQRLEMNFLPQETVTLFTYCGYFHQNRLLVSEANKSYN